eukprot:12235549-Alexandrium_andersonii.AAC.1
MLERAAEERARAVLRSLVPSPQSCSICGKKLSADAAWRSSREERCCLACVDTCLRCLQAHRSFPAAGNP